MRRCRISISGLMVLIAVLAVDWAVMKTGMAVSEKALRHNLSLCYSWAPDRRHLPKDEPVFSEYIDILDGGRVTEGLALLALGAVPMVSLFGLGCVIMFRNLASQGRCSPFLLGFIASGTAVLSSYVVSCMLATDWVQRYADWMLYLPARMIGNLISEEIRRAMVYSGVTLVLGLPQVLVAVLGGRLNARMLRIALVVMPRIATDSLPAIMGGADRPTGSHIE